MTDRLPHSHHLRNTAIEIWAHGIRAVAPRACLQRCLAAAPGELQLFDSRRSDSATTERPHSPNESICHDLTSPSFRLKVFKKRPVLVAGGGKAVVGMASGLLERLGDAGVHRDDIRGLLSVPEAGTAGFDVDRWPIEVRQTRPRNENLPTEACVAATRQMKNLLRQAPETALVFCLVSGGASALLCDPPETVALSEQRRLAESMSRAGLTIQQMNTVRQHLDNVKGGRLAACFSGDELVTLVLSDVLGDRLEWIGGGPTVPPSTTPADALGIVQQLAGRGGVVPPAVVSALRTQCAVPRFPARQRHVLAGNLAMAVSSAARRARRLGWRVAKALQQDPEVTAEQAAAALVQKMFGRATSHEPFVLIDGGEPVVRVPPSCGRGGRNTHLVLAALSEIVRRIKVGQGATFLQRPFVLLSAASDGEDGSADACGACIDDRLVRRVVQHGPDPEAYLERFDSRGFFEVLGDGLLERSPAPATNVCDLRVALVGPTA